MSYLENSGRINNANRLNNRTCCCVPGCHTSARREDVSFHKFPRRGNTVIVRSDEFGNTIRVERRTAWEKALKLTRPASIYVRVCEKHFAAEDYIPGTSKKKHLKSTAVPSRNLPRMPQEMYKRKQYYKNWKTNFQNRKVTETNEVTDHIEIIDLESDTESIEAEIEGKVENAGVLEDVEGVKEYGNAVGDVKERIDSVIVKQQTSADDNFDLDEDDDVIEVVPFFS